MVGTETNQHRSLQFTNGSLTAVESGFASGNADLAPGGPEAMTPMFSIPVRRS